MIIGTLLQSAASAPLFVNLHAAHSWLTGENLGERYPSRASSGQGMVDQFLP
jgi:hypothetical protein